MHQDLILKYKNKEEVSKNVRLKTYRRRDLLQWNNFFEGDVPGEERKELKIKKDVVKRMKMEIELAGTFGVPVNRYRAVVHNDEIILIIHKRTGRYVYTEYIPELYLLLVNPGIVRYDCRDGRTKSGKIKEGRMQIIFHLHDDKKEMKYNEFKRYFYRFVYDFNITGLDFIDYVKVTRMFGREIFIDTYIDEDGEKRSMEIDHLDDNKRNCCTWNLSQMTKEQNSTKGTYFSKIKWPYYCFGAVDDNGGYRIRVGNLLSGRGYYYYCKTVDDLIFLLEKISGKVKPHLWKESTGYASQNSYYNMLNAVILLAYPRGIFMDVKAKMKNIRIE